MGEEITNEMEEIIQDFIQETIEILESLDKDLVILEETPNDTELLNRIFRSIHTVKGTSGFLGFERLTSVAHKTEDILNKLRKEDIKLTHRLMDLILIGVDGVKVLFGEIQEDGTEKAEIEETVMRLEQGLMEESLKQSQGEEESGIVPVPDLKVSEPPSTPQESPAEKAPVKEETPKEAPKMLGELLVEKNLVSEQDILEASKEQKKLGEILVEKNLLEKEQLDAVLAEQREAQAKNFKNKTEGQTIRVDVDRLDNLLNQVGELVFERNRLIDMVKKLSSGDGSEGHGQLGDKLGAISDDLNFITGQLQMSVLKMRMIPIGRVFNKFPRVVRDLSRKIEKEVELIISGEETELDKSVIEELGDPLTHIVRNSIDHGLETPEEREALGKPRKGRIWLTASQEGSFIIISIKDDGRGINLEAVKKKALEKGIVSADKLKTLTNSEIINFIFAPGFSTAKVVTDVSGRGVGMDVVRTNIKKINGSIDVKSVPGQGTEMILKLPLTLAIIQSLLVTVGQERFAIPLAVVVETLKINKSEIKTIERQEVLKLRNEVLSLLRMADFYKVETSKELENPYIVIVKAAERKLGLIVDTLLGQEEIVIKPLGELLKDTKGISGATIMGDGLVTLIVDIATLVGGTTKNPLIRDSHDDAREFVRLIEGYSEIREEEFLQRLALFHQKEGGEFLEETLSILLSPGTPLQLQDLILKTFSRRPTPAVLGTMLTYLKRPPPLKLFHQALECIRPFPSFEVEASLHSLKRDASPPYQELIAQVLKSFYRKQELRYFRILLGERRDKLLWEESWEYFIGHPDPALALHLLPLLVEEEENVREKALDLISRIPDPPVEVTEFLSRLIKTLFSRGGESRFLGRILYVFSLSSYPHRVGAAEKFLKNLEEEIGEIFLPFRHSAYLPLRRAFYRPLYEEYYRRGGEEEKTLVIKHIPVPLEEWAKDLLRQALKERTLPLAREAWRRILEERLVGEYLEEALVCPGEMKKELLSVASELASPLPLDLVRSFLLQEGDEVVEKTVLYLRESRTPWPLEFLQTVLFSNLSLQRRRSLFPLIFREGNQERLVEFLKRVVQRRKEGVLRGIEGVWVGGVARLIREGELDDRSLNSLVDPLMLLFEEAEEEPLVVQILLALRELRADEATLEFLLQELKDKQLQELKRRGESSSLGVLLHQTQREIEKKQLLLRSSAQVKERLDRISHEIPRKKEALGELYRWLLEKPDPLLLKEAKGKVGEALLGEIAKPFQSRERKKMVLELVSLLGLTEAVPLLKTFALTSTPDLKDLLIKTLTQLEEK